MIDAESASILTRTIDFVRGDAWEIAGFVTGLASVALTVRQNVWCWPTGIVNAVCFIVMFFQAKLYADVGLNGFFFVLSVYGWWAWLHPGAGKLELPVTRTPAWAWGIGGASFVVGTGIMGTFFAHTDASFPWVDSATTVASLVAQWYLTRKWIENWWIWIAADVVMIAMYAMKGLWLTSALYLLFAILCVAGIRDWLRSLAAAPATA